MTIDEIQVKVATPMCQWLNGVSIGLGFISQCEELNVAVSAH